MTRSPLLRPVSLLVLLTAGCGTPPEPITPEREFLTLFDGSSLEGWEGDARFWRVEEGRLVGESTPENPCDRTTYLRYAPQEFADFELMVRYRVLGGNSGVQFRSRPRPDHQVAGYQADLEAGPQWTGGLYEQDGRGVVTRRGERVVLTTADTTRERFASGEALQELVLDEDWNTLVVEAFGPRITIWVNGERMSETLDLDPEHAARRGSIALQLHQGPPMRVEFEDVVLRPLVAPTPGPAAQGVPLEADAGSARWIWPGPAQADQEVWFHRSFELAEVPEEAALFVTADNHFRLHVNGELVARSSSWENPRRLNVAEHLAPGTNHLALWSKNDGGPAGMFLSLELPDRRIESDTRWSATTEEPADTWTHGFPGEQPVLDLGALGSEPWGRLGVEQPAEPPTATAPEDVKVPEGFAVELVYVVPRELQGSWVSLCEDDQGRLVAGDQYGALYRLTLGNEIEVEEILLDVGHAQGLAWHRDALYVVASGGSQGSGLFRVRDTDEDDRLDEVMKLADFEGSGEHGPHAVVPAPDGSLWVLAGNHTALPSPITRSRVPEIWGEDQVLVRLPDPNGHAVGKLAPGGWVARTDDEGASWELIACGMRNAYDLAFDANGEPFTYDSDMEWDTGLPWYRPTRILHLESGADFGWRHGSGKWSTHVPDTLPAVVDLALGSPTGVAFAPDSFPPPFAGTLLAGDWAYGRLHAVGIEPSGGGFVGTSEVLLEGEPLPITDFVSARDGHVYFLIGGRRVQSALYRLRWAGAPSEAPTGIEAPTAARQRTRALAAGHGRGDEGWSEAAWEPLDSSDRFERHAARVALEHRSPSAWRERLGTESRPRALLAGGLALTRVDPEAALEDLPPRLLELEPATADPGTLLEIARIVQLLHARAGVEGDARLETLGRALLARYPTERPEIDRELLVALVPLAPEGLVPTALEAAAEADDAETLFLLHALARVTRGFDPWSRLEAQARLERLEETFRGGNSARGYLEAVGRDLRARLGIETVETLVAEDSPPPTTSAPGEGDGGAWTLERAQPLLATIAQGRDFARGRDLFRSRTCHDCHRLGGQGGNQGPDLTGVAGRMSARDLVEATLDPSREVPDAWQETELWSDDRLVAVGRLEDLDDERYVLRSLPPANERLEVFRVEVTEARAHPLSRMPKGLAEGLRDEEILDLLAYVLAGGDPGHSMYEE